MVNVFFDGKEYKVPADLTIMTAMEYAGFSLVRGCGCRHGFCGACATIYRLQGKNYLHFVLACQTQVEEGMYVATLPFFPLNRRNYNLEELSASHTVIMSLFPEIYACVACNTCTKGCSRDLNVMQYIAYAKRNDLVSCAHESFDCVGCGICAARCPSEISHPLVGLLARRLTGKYILPESKHNKKRVEDINLGKFDIALDQMASLPSEEIRKLYNQREIEV